MNKNKPHFSYIAPLVALFSLLLLQACGGSSSSSSTSKSNQEALVFAESSVELVIGGTHTNTISGGSGSGALSYSSDDTSIATVDSTGKVTAVALGDTTISATKAADSSYNSASASYSVSVKQSVEVSGSVVAGLVDSASVKIYKMEQGAATDLLQETITDSIGNYTVKLGIYSGPYMVVATGGTYTDEATGESRSIDGEIRAVNEIAEGAATTTAVVTPLTEVASQLAISSGDIGGSNQKVAELFLGKSGDDAGEALLSTAPAVATDPDSATKSDDERIYGLMLAVLSTAEQDSNQSQVIADLVNDIGDDADLDEQGDTLQQAASEFIVGDTNNLGINDTDAIDGILEAAVEGDVTEIELSSSNDIIAFYVEGILAADIDYVEHKISALMPYDTNLTSLRPTVAVSIKASVTPESGSSQDFDGSSVVYEVTAEDGSVQVWLVDVTAAEDTRSPEAKITDVIHEQVTAFIINDSKAVITGEVVAGGLGVLDSIADTDLSTIFTISETAQQISKTSGSFSSGYVEFTVTAENDDERIWQVKLNERAKSNQPKLSIVHLDQNITELDLLVTESNATKLDLDAVGGIDSLALSFSSDDTSIAQIDQDTGLLELVASGETTIRASRPAGTVGDVDYKRVEAKIRLIVNKQQQGALAFDDMVRVYSETVVTQQLAPRSGSEGSGEGQLLYYTSNPNTASVTVSGSVTFLAAGSATIWVIKEGDDQYLSTSTTFTITINRAEQESLSFAASSVTYTVGQSGRNTLSGGSGEGSIAYASSNPTIAIVDSTGLVTAVADGTVTITATKASDNNYEQSNQAEYTLIVNPANQSTNDCIWGSSNWGECNWASASTN